MEGEDGHRDGQRQVMLPAMALEAEYRQGEEEEHDRDDGRGGPTGRDRLGGIELLPGLHGVGSSIVVGFA